MKLCNHCKTEKEYSEFNKDRYSRDGFDNECRECHSYFNKIWRLKNLDKCLNQSREWKRNNKEKNLATTKKWQKKQFDTNSDYALAHSLRTRLNQALRSNYKAGSAVKDLGCSIEEFRKHIEHQFKPGMSWNNRGRWGENVWHIDHIKPLSKFDLTNREEFLKACHYSNLQPMWCDENNIKGGA
jgi:hypothetical protein